MADTKTATPAWPFNNPAWPFQPVGGASVEAQALGDAGVPKSAAEKALEKEQLIKEKEAAAALAERESRLAAKREAEAKAVALAEAEAAKAAALAEAEWKRSYARMDDKEVLSQQLEKELSNELKEVREKLQKAEQAVLTIEQDIADAMKSSADAKEAKAQEIDALGSHMSSLKQVVSLVRGYESECVQLEKELDADREARDARDENAIGIANRLTEEVEEAEARLTKAEGRGAELEARLTALKSEAVVKEKSAQAEVDRLSSVAIAARLQATLGTRHKELLVSELSRLQEAENEANRYRTKKAHSEQTREAVEKLRAQLQEDEAQERRLELAGEAAKTSITAAAQASKRMAQSYATEIEQAKKLAATQNDFLEVAAAKIKSVEDEGARAILESTAKLCEERRAATLATIARLEEEQKEKESVDMGSDEASRGTIKLNAAELKAVQAARAEHEKYLATLEKQLEDEDKSLRMALEPIAGRDESISIIRAELTKARGDAEGLEEAAVEAEEAHEAAARQLQTLQTKHKSAATSLKVQIDSEHSVAKDQHRYVAKMRNRLLLAKEAAPAEIDMDVRRRGKTLIDDSAAAAKAELSAAEAALKEQTTSKDAVSDELKAVDTKSESTIVLLQEQLTAAKSALKSLKTYESSLATRAGK